MSEMVSTDKGSHGDDLKSIACTEAETAESSIESENMTIISRLHIAKGMEELCEEELHKSGTAYIAKSMECYGNRNYLEMLRNSDLALAKLNEMKKRRLETISEALAVQCQALKFMGRHVEALQSAKAMYNLCEMETGPAHLCTIDSAFYLVESSLFNRQFQG